MGTGRSGHAPRIDADEDDPEVGPKDVRHLTLSRIHFGHVLRESNLFPHGGHELPSGTVGDDPSRSDPSRRTSGCSTPSPTACASVARAAAYEPSRTDTRF